MVRSRLLAGLALWLCAGCRSGPLPEETTLLVGRTADAIGLDPARITDSESIEVADQIFETLLRVRRGSTLLEPGLATRWERSADGRTWTFHLRPGVRFHDDTPLDADAVLFSFARQRDKAHPQHTGNFAWEALFRNIVRIDKVDPLTVRMEIEASYAPFLANLAMFPMSIVSPTAVARWGEDFARHPVGTGPFRFVEWAPGERITLAASPQYWDGMPTVRNLAFVPVRDARQRLLALEGGAIDVAENLAPQDLQFVVLHPELRTEHVAGFNVSYLAMNTTHPPFDDVRVRRAVALAVRKNPIVKLVYQGLAVEATGTLPPTMWGHRAADRLPPDPAQARRLLAEAGWGVVQKGAARRPPPRLLVMNTPRSYMPAPERVARMIAQDLHDVGMDVEVVVSDFSSHLRAVSAGEHDLCLLGWGSDNGDPDNVLYTLFHSENAEVGQARNVSFFRDEKVDELLHAAQTALEQPRREELYQQAQRLIADQVPLVPLAHSEIVVALRRNVRGLWLPPTTTLHFDRVTLAAE